MQMLIFRVRRALVLAVICSLSPALGLSAEELGLFESHGDIGKPKVSGSVEFRADANAYRVSGGGTNMWFTEDAFQFVWKKVSGDMTLAADITFEGSGGDPHRKACLLIRQSL